MMRRDEQLSLVYGLDIVTILLAVNVYTQVSEEKISIDVQKCRSHDSPILMLSDDQFQRPYK